MLLPCQRQCPGLARIIPGCKNFLRIGPARLVAHFGTEGAAGPDLGFSFTDGGQSIDERRPLRSLESVRAIRGGATRCPVLRSHRVNLPQLRLGVQARPS
jgi:hypothetical protein